MEPPQSILSVHVRPLRLKYTRHSLAVATSMDLLPFCSLCFHQPSYMYTRRGPHTHTHTDIYTSLIAPLWNARYAQTHTHTLSLIRCGYTIHVHCICTVAPAGTSFKRFSRSFHNIAGCAACICTCTCSTACMYMYIYMHTPLLGSHAKHTSPLPTWTTECFPCSSCEV